MSSKRPPDNALGPSSVKRLKSESTSSQAGTNGPVVDDALIARKRAEIAAKLAAMTGKKTTVVSGPIHTGPAPPQPSHFSKEDTAALQLRIEEAKKKVSAARVRSSLTDNPYLSATSSGTQTPVNGAGLKMTAHPLLLDTTPTAPQSKRDKYKPMQPKFATLKANARNAPPAPPVAPPPVELKANPYSAASSKDSESGAPKDRMGRSFRFNQKGKYVALANQVRKDQQLEALKQRIAESAKKAGLDSEFETVEKNIRRAAPPEAEWWDASLLPTKAYDDFSMANVYIRTSNSPITLYIQHPIPIPGPGSAQKAEAKPLKLTTKEQKKMRKQRRQAELQDKRDHIRMGLLPPDPPKVRLGNLMRVLTSDAVQDPTRVEARVRREVALRKHGHSKMNAERKLSPDSRRAKVEEKKAAEELKGLVGAIFRVRILSDPAHRFKVRKNAEQLNLTGICIFHPGFSMVYVEGAARFVRNYKRLMLERIAWTQAARPRADADVEVAELEGEGDSIAPAVQETVNDEGQTVSLESNRCDCIWEGEIVERSFKNFRPKSCPTDAIAREALGPKLASRWDATKSWKPQEDDLF